MRWCPAEVKPNKTAEWSTRCRLSVGSSDAGARESGLSCYKLNSQFHQQQSRCIMTFEAQEAGLPVVILQVRVVLIPDLTVVRSEREKTGVVRRSRVRVVIVDAWGQAESRAVNALRVVRCSLYRLPYSSFLSLAPARATPRALARPFFAMAMSTSSQHAADRVVDRHKQSAAVALVSQCQVTWYILGKVFSD